MTSRVIDWIRELGFDSLNIDLIYGLPLQTVPGFEKTIDEILKLNPDRIALFSYAHVPWIKPAQKILEAGKLPSAEEKLQILKMAVEKLTAGDRYIYIGMDHFAKPSDELAVAQRTHRLHRNFQGYSTHGGTDIYAFGISGISQTENAYWQNEKELPKYYQALDAGKSPIAKGYLVTEEDKVRRETIMRIMCDLSLNYSQIGQKFGIRFEEFFSREIEALAPLEQDNLIRFTEEGFEVTATGRLLIRNIAMQFDGYTNSDAEKRYSKTI
jgi:oxygen-independent coproporphyrinogen-3 oxidase